MKLCIAILTCAFLISCAPKVENDHDVIGEIVINPKDNSCVFYEKCVR